MTAIDSQKKTQTAIGKKFSHDFVQFSKNLVLHVTVNGLHK